MKRTRNILAMLMVFTLICTAFVGCGNSSAASTSTSEPASEQAVASEAAEEAPAAAEEVPEAAESAAEVQPAAEAEVSAEEAAPVEEKTVEYPLADETINLTLFFSVSPNLAELMESMNDICCYDVAEQVTNVHLDATISTPETTSEKFQVMIASGTYTDLIHGVAQNYAGGLEKAVDDEVLLDLNPYIEDYAPDYQRFLDSNEEASKLYKTEAGYMAAIQGISYNFVQGPIIRQDWLDDCGLDTPETIDELENVLLAFKDQKGATNSILFTTGNIYLAAGFNLGQGTADGSDGAVYNVIDGEVQMCYFEDEYYNFIDTLANWNREGLFTSDFVSLFGSGVANSYVLSDDTGFWMGAQDNIGSAFAASYTGASDHFESVAIAMPTLNKGDTVDTGTMISTSGEQWSVSTSCEQPEIAVAYLNWFFTDQGTEVCNYGIEGESFEYDADGNAVYTDLITNNPDLSQMQAQWLYTSFQAPYLQADDRNSSLYADDSQKEALSIWNSNRTNDRAYYGSMTTDESEEYTNIASDLETYANEQILKYILNEETLTEDVWATFLETLESMGAEDMTAIEQQAYDRYLTK